MNRLSITFEFDTDNEKELFIAFEKSCTDKKKLLKALSNSIKQEPLYFTHYRVDMQNLGTKKHHQLSISDKKTQ